MRLALISAALLLMSCGPSADQSPDDPVGDTGADTNVAWLLEAQGPPATMAAEVRAELHIDIGRGCVTIGDRQNGLPVVFPQGTALDLSDPANAVLVTPEGERIPNGAEVVVSGGAVPIDGIESQEIGSYADIVVPDRCGVDSVWLASSISGS